MENNSRDLLKNRHNDSLKKSQHTLSQGMMKNGDVIIDANDGVEERISASQNHATALLCTEEFFFMSQCI